MAEAKGDFEFIKYQQELFEKHLLRITDLVGYAQNHLEDVDFSDFHKKL